MTTSLRYDGRVAIVTGAGGGLGREHALMLASRGARVVVNDLGSDQRGHGTAATAADDVVAQIRASGGEAIASHASVERGEEIVATAVEAFGTVDIVVNNAGILRDVSFPKMSDEDWHLVQRVHLDGAKSVTQAAWPILREKNYGRVVMTTSAAGIYGNFGQANYAAAKLAVLGLANALAEEGRTRNILVNTIAPIAASRMTESIFSPDLLERLRPEAVSPLVGWLCHERCRETKGLFEVGAGYFAKLRWQRSTGFSFADGQGLSPDDVADRWNEITDFSEAEYPSTIQDSLNAVSRTAFEAK